VPSTWVSGVYEAVFSSSTSKFQSATPFWVTDTSRDSDVLFISSLNTYEAYNNYPWDTTDPNAATPPTGRSLYDFNSAGGTPAYQVTFDRPFTNEYGGDGLGGDGVGAVEEDLLEHALFGRVGQGGRDFPARPRVSRLSRSPQHRIHEPSGLRSGHFARQVD